MNWNGGLPDVLAVLAWCATCVGAMLLASHFQAAKRRGDMEEGRYHAVKRMAARTVGYAACPRCDGPLTYQELCRNCCDRCAREPVTAEEMHEALWGDDE